MPTSSPETALLVPVTHSVRSEADGVGRALTPSQAATKAHMSDSSAMVPACDA